MEYPLTLFIGVVSLKAGGKGKPLGRVGGRESSEQRVDRGGIEKRGRLMGPSDSEVRQRRYPCLRQEFHSIGSIKMGTGRGE